MMSNKLAKRFAWSFCGVVAIAAMWQTASEALNSTPPSSLLAILTSASYTLMQLAFSALGALVITRQPHNTIGWLMLAPALSTILSAFSTPFVSNVTVPPSDPSSLFLVAVWANRISWVPAVFPFLLILLLFPTGRPPSRRWNGLVLAVVGLQMLFLLVVSFGRHLWPFSEAWSVANPIGVIPDEWVRTLYSMLLQVILSVLVLLCMASLFVRYKQGSIVEKTQIKWIAFASIIFGPLNLVTILTVVARGKGWGSDDPVVLAVQLPASLTVITIPVMIAIAILRHHLFDIDLIINRTLVYGTLSAGVVGIYVLLVGALGALFGSSGNLVLALLATGLAAFLIQPLRERLQRSVNRLMYGERDDPYTVLSRLSQQLKTTLAPAAMLPKIAETIGQTLKLPYVALALNQGDRLEIAAAYGMPVGEPEQLPLVYHGEPVGQLLVARRAPGETFTPAERRLLEEIAVQAGVAAQAVRLTADLQRSRERLITAREEERRRLHRDLHDGLGPQLASLTLTVAAVRELLRHDVDAADMLLQELATHTQAAIADIRRVVYDLRPPALDDLGLVLALREQAASYRQAGLQITIDAPDQLPPLPAAVEVAAYRIVQEALTNVVRHAQARSCVVHLTLCDALDVEIRDDGVGLPPGGRAGVGLMSMRERTAELGGIYRVESIPGRGTCIHAQLPLHQEGV